jgi:hypothetical protein
MLADLISHLLQIFKESDIKINLIFSLGCFQFNPMSLWVIFKVKVKEFFLIHIIFIFVEISHISFTFDLIK